MGEWMIYWTHLLECHFHLKDHVTYILVSFNPFLSICHILLSCVFLVHSCVARWSVFLMCFTFRPNTLYCLHINSPPFPACLPFSDQPSPLLPVPFMILLMVFFCPFFTLLNSLHYFLNFNLFVLSFAQFPSFLFKVQLLLFSFSVFSVQGTLQSLSHCSPFPLNKCSFYSVSKPPLTFSSITHSTIVLSQALLVIADQDACQSQHLRTPHQSSCQH